MTLHFVWSHLSKKQTVLLIFDRWLHEIDQNCDVVNRILVGNKDDDPDRKVVLSEDAHRYARQMGIQLFEASAMNNTNVEESFRAIAELALRTKREQQAQMGKGKAQER